MGLDIYPSRERDDVVLRAEDKLAFAALDLKLCEWGGNGSFRGKVYLDVVELVAGVCLTQDWIPPEEVAEIAAAFEVCDPEEVARLTADDRHAVTPDEVRSLRKLLRVCATHGLGFIGSY